MEERDEKHGDEAERQGEARRPDGHIGGAHHDLVDAPGVHRVEPGLVGEDSEEDGADELPEPVHDLLHALRKQPHEDVGADVLMPQLHERERQEHHQDHVIDRADLEVALDRAAEHIRHEHVRHRLQHHQHDADARDERKGIGQAPDCPFDHPCPLCRTASGHAPSSRRLASAVLTLPFAMSAASASPERRAGGPQPAPPAVSMITRSPGESSVTIFEGISTVLPSRRWMTERAFAPSPPPAMPDAATTWRSPRCEKDRAPSRSSRISYSLSWPSPPRNSPAPPESAQSDQRLIRIGASSSIASAGRFMQFVASVSIASTPSKPRPAPLPPPRSSPVTKAAPSRRRPPKAITRSSPAEGTGTRSGSTVASAESMQPVIRLIVAERAFTGAGERGLTRLPSGKVRLIGRKQPPLFGIDGSVTALTAKQAAARLPDGTQLTGPRACGLVPVRSKWMSPPATVTATSTRSRRSSSMPSLSSQSTWR